MMTSAVGSGPKTINTPSSRVLSAPVFTVSQRADREKGTIAVSSSATGPDAHASDRVISITAVKH